MPEYSESRAAILDAICRRHADAPGALLPILHEVQERLGHIPGDAVAGVAERLNLTRAEVDGVVGFYTDFRREPAPARVVKVCRAEACQAVGGREVYRAAVAAAEAAGGTVEVEAVYCLGNCACSPAGQVDGETLGRLDTERVTRLVAGTDGEVPA
ncbi:NAD(P)H-dependent oxidoreductase subunit E [Arhodomonas sp. KWT2]|uniref:NAD(P)H-dependent oxidoreductase subunit E n=1 Tax=Arhodomonas sp. KWT2 TaxID=3344194 RepID=UPI0035C0173A